MTTPADLILTYSFIKRLVLPFREWDAYKEGIIDFNGKVLKPRTNSPNWGLFDILIANLKKLIQSLPGGKTRIATIAAAMILLKENNHNDIEKKLFEYIDLLEDDVPTNNISSGNVAKFDPLLKINKKEILLKRKQPNEILKEAKNPRFVARWSTNPEHLERLSKHRKWEVKSSVARNSATPHHILDALSKDEYWNIRRSVARNSATPHHILHVLSKDEDADVRYYLLYNPSIHPDILHILSKDKNQDVRNIALENLKGRKE